MCVLHTRDNPKLLSHYIDNTICHYSTKRIGTSLTVDISSARNVTTETEKIDIGWEDASLNPTSYIVLMTPVST